MNDPILFKRLFDALVLPPGGPLVLMALGLALWRRMTALGLALTATGLTALYLACTGAVGSWLLGPVEQRHPPLAPLALREAMRQPPERRPQAIVVLGGGARRGVLDAPDGESVNARTLERVAAGLRAQRATGLPILVSGGVPVNAQRSEAALMARALTDLGGQARWVEATSLDTADNATGTRDTLAAEGIRRVLLVTHAYHLPRAVLTFERAGLEVMPMPAAWLAQPVDDWRAWLPGAGALELTWIALHERAGLAWYRWRGVTGPGGAFPAASAAPRR